MIPQLKQQGNRMVLMVNGAPFVALAGEVHNSDSSSPAYMEKIWQIADDLGMNTLLLPVTWEMTEPMEGQFDFSVPGALIDQARKRGMHIIFLWFGSWKNAECMYAPEWVKRDTIRFERGQIEKGENKAGRRISKTLPFKMPYTTISYLSENAMQADAKAFAALMAFIRDYDKEQQTVIAVQVENETGLLGAAREQSDAADAAFASAVPEDFISKLRASSESMVEDIRNAVENSASSGSWREVFGDAAEELFSAYYVSRFVEYVAAAGKAVYPLPMSVNCWLNKPGDTPGLYPSGGPVSRVQEVWRINAPSIDAYSPDIYVPQFYEVCDEFTRRTAPGAADNKTPASAPLFIPEAAVHSYCASRLVNTVGQYHAVCYSPFGFDDIGKPFSAAQGFLFGMDVSDPALKTPQSFDEYAATQKLLKGLLPVLGQKLGTADLQAASGERAPKTSLLLGDVKVTAEFKNQIQPRSDGYLLAVRSGKDELYLLGSVCSVKIESTDSEKKNLDYLLIEEGSFDENAAFKAGRRLNGDEMAMLGFSAPGILHIRYLTYA